MTSRALNWLLAAAVLIPLSGRADDPIDGASRVVPAPAPPAPRAAPARPPAPPAAAGVPAAPARTAEPPPLAPVTSLEVALPDASSIPSGGFPGLGAVAPPPDLAGPAVINLQPGITAKIKISGRMPNRIATPFTQPKVVDTSGAQIIINDADVFVVPASATPFSIFITDAEPGKPVAALTLIPDSSLDAQSVLLQIDRSANPYHAHTAAQAEETRETSAYESQIVYLLRKVVNGQQPKGFVEATLNVPPFSIGPVRGVPSKRWAGTTMDIYRYDLTNRSNNWVELTEQSIYESGVKAVAFFPRVRLAPGESTYAFVVAAGRTDPATRR